MPVRSRAHVPTTAAAEDLPDRSCVAVSIESDNGQARVPVGERLSNNDRCAPGAGLLRTGTLCSNRYREQEKEQQRYPTGHRAPSLRPAGYVKAKSA